MNSMDSYRQQVCNYFQLEFSDFSFAESIDRIHVSKNIPYPEEPEFTTIGSLEEADAQKMHRLKWENKIDHIITTFHESGKPASQAAAKLAELLKTYTRSNLLDE